MPLQGHRGAEVHNGEPSAYTMSVDARRDDCSCSGRWGVAHERVPRGTPLMTMNVRLPICAQESAAWETADDDGRAAADLRTRVSGETPLIMVGGHRRVAHERVPGGTPMIDGGGVSSDPRGVHSVSPSESCTCMPHASYVVTPCGARPTRPPTKMTRHTHANAPRPTPRPTVTAAAESKLRREQNGLTLRRLNQ